MCEQEIVGFKARLTSFQGPMIYCMHGGIFEFSATPHKGSRHNHLNLPTAFGAIPVSLGHWCDPHERVGT